MNDNIKSGIQALAAIIAEETNLKSGDSALSLIRFHFREAFLAIRRAEKEATE